jgi:serine/threonine-protein kinase RsbW
MRSVPTSRWLVQLPSTTSRLASLRARLRRILGTLALPESTTHDLVLAAHEAAVNAIVHGNRQDPRKRVKVVVEFVHGGVAVEVQDEGEGFDWTVWVGRAHEAPTDPHASRGRGIYVIHALMDQVIYDEAGTRVRMWKRLPPA